MFCNHCFFFARRHVPSLRGAAPRVPSLRRTRLRCTALHRARAAQRAWRQAEQRARSLCCPVLPCSAQNHAARGTRRAARERTRCCAFLHPYDSASTRRRLSYRRHAQPLHATRRSSCSAAIDACRMPTALPAQVIIAVAAANPHCSPLPLTGVAAKACRPRSRSHRQPYCAC
jgi:hypothetical protein